MMQLNSKLKQGEPIIGTWISLGDPAVVEVVAQTDFDFLLIDGEHAPLGTSELVNLLRAMKGSKTAAIYRVPENRESHIKMALDAGCDGVVVPRVNSALDAKMAVEAAKYYPQGKRGVGPWRASNYYEEMDQYVAKANAQTTLILQIEDKIAVNNLDEILAVPGIDALYIGPADLTASLGHFPHRDHPEVMSVMQEIAKKCVAAGMPLGIDSLGTDNIRQMRKWGMQIFTWGMDLSYIIEGAKKAAAEARSGLN